MQIPARYQDGLVAAALDVTCRIDPLGIHIADPVNNAEIAVWQADDIFPIHARRNELRIGANGKPYGARLVFTGATDASIARKSLPGLDVHHRRERGRQWSLMGLTTVALVSVVVAYIYGVPLLARNIVQAIPVEWEQQFGDKVAEQIEAALTEEQGFEVCDPDPNSLANRAISRFADAAMAEAGSPFKPDIQVIRSTVPNAFALPGGKSFYFSALLEQTDTPDEFAGVMAHELGHVVHRHAMEQLIASAGTGLLIGFILGDMTGISVAGGLGVALIDSRFSREAEVQADKFSAETAKRLNFQPAGLANLLERVAGDDDFTKALALLSTHPLTTERRQALERSAADISGPQQVFSDAEWQAIKHMCDDSGTTPAATPAGSQAPAPPPASAWPPAPPKTGDKNTRVGS
jgi:Zn-dependent protease with chaperone function